MIFVVLLVLIIVILLISTLRSRAPKHRDRTLLCDGEQAVPPRRFETFPPDVRHRTSR